MEHMFPVYYETKFGAIGTNIVGAKVSNDFDDFLSNRITRSETGDPGR